MMRDRIRMLAQGECIMRQAKVTLLTMRAELNKTNVQH